MVLATSHGGRNRFGVGHRRFCTVSGPGPIHQGCFVHETFGRGLTFIALCFCLICSESAAPWMRWLSPTPQWIDLNFTLFPVQRDKPHAPKYILFNIRSKIGGAVVAMPRYITYAHLRKIYLRYNHLKIDLFCSLIGYPSPNKTWNKTVAKSINM